MKLKSGIILISALFSSFLLLILVLYTQDLLKTDDVFGLLMQGFTFLTIFFLLILTIKMKAHLLLVLGSFFVTASTCINLLEDMRMVELVGFWNAVLGNGLVTLGILLCSVGLLGLLTKRNELNEKLIYQATHDSLTGLPNFHKMNENLQNTLTRCQQNNQPLAVMFLDLDRFKFVNDTKGHKAGDSVLQEVAKRLSAQVPEGQLVARKGGDEFLVVLENTDVTAASQVGKRFLQSFEESFRVHNDEFFISTSIGISLFPQDGERHDVLVNKADKAMYYAKKHGKNKFHFFVSEAEDTLSRKVTIEADLRKAISHHELALHYQPKVELKTGRLMGVEALLRWNHPVLGMIPPTEFIPVAEESGMIVSIGEWVIETACKQNKNWKDQGFPPLSIAVNVSALQFHDGKLVHQIQQALEKHQIAPECFEIEITESVMQDVVESFQAIKELKELGIRIAIDDFGTGYSSLSLLHKLTVDYVKIDKSFIQEIFTNKASAALVTTIIEMGSIMNFRLVAEGIEEEAQAVFLIENGCHIGQGFFYSRPLPEKELKELMEKQWALHQN